jgi:hypothetical protein
MRRHALPGALAAVLVAASARAENNSQPSPDDALRAEVARQGAAIEELRAALDAGLEKERRERENPAIRVSGFVQADWVIHNQESQNEIDASSQPLNQDRFLLRRGHVRVDAAKGLFSGVLEIDANTVSGPQVRPIEGSIAMRWPEKPDARVPSFSAILGLQRIPFGFEVQEADYVRPFLERATMLQALFPGEYDLGLRFAMSFRFLDLRLGVMNGSPIGNKVFPDLDPVQAKEVVGHIGVDVEIAPGVRFQAGVSADTGSGFHPGTPATKNVLVWQDQNGDGLVEPNEITAIGGSPATPSQVFHRFALGGDARIIVRVPTLGDLTFRGEAVNALNLDRGLEVADPVGAGHDLREVGWSGAATQELTRWAMVGARYDLYNPNGDDTRQRALHLVPVDRSYTTLALMGMVRYQRARLLFEYDIRTNPLGIGANGSPTTLADNAVTLRGQLVF